MADKITFFEIGARDASASARFYRDIFGWKTVAYGPAVETIDNAGIHGMVNSSALKERSDYVLLYVEVRNIETKLAEIEALGGRRLTEPIKVSRGTYAWFEDPRGNLFGLWQKP